MGRFLRVLGELVEMSKPLLVLALEFSRPLILGNLKVLTTGSKENRSSVLETPHRLCPSGFFPHFFHKYIFLSIRHELSAHSHFCCRLDLIAHERSVQLGCSPGGTELSKVEKQ